jgi:long-subunit acyl-CoA synthetase (AMP-forming)
VSFADRARYAIGDVLVYGPLRNVLGMSRIRIAYTAGAAIGPDLFRFYRSIGINMKQLYGSTETCAYVCLQPDDAVKLDTVGKPAPHVEVRIGDNGEVLVRGPMLLTEYYNRPDATAESIDPQGYFRTGDAGLFDADGQLSIIDRAKDVGKLAAARCSRPTTSRTSSSSRRTSRKPSRSATRATRSARSSTSTWARSATGPSGAGSRTRATPTSPPSPRSSS